MSFINPLGLIGLLGIPIIIIIYIIKSKYKEYTIASTYIWELSEKFLTKKSRISSISGILSLILQIMAVLVLSFALAHPIVSIPNSAKNYVFVIDNSASMNIGNRLQNAKDEMCQFVDSAKNDSQFTLVLAEEESYTLCESLSDKLKVKTFINNIENNNISCSVVDAMDIAQNIFNEDESVNVYLFTDTRYINIENMDVKNYEKNEINIALHSLYYTNNDEKMNFLGEVIAYDYVEYGDSELEKIDIELSLFLDNEFKSTTSVELNKNEKGTFSFEIDACDFNEAKVVYEGVDDLALDNQYISFKNSAIDKYNVLLVSEKPFFIQSVLATLGDVDLDVILPKQYNDNLTKAYDLYIFDCYSPKIIPENGAVWLFNAKESIANSGFVSQGHVTNKEGYVLEYATGKDNIFMSLVNNITKSPIHINSYEKYNLLSKFTPILYNEASENADAVVFAGINSSNNREIVFAFDLHDSDFPLTLDFVIFFNNMVKFSIPSLCDQSEFKCGDDLILNVLPNCESIRVNTPDGFSTFLTLTEDIATFHLNQIGVHSIESIINGVKRMYYIYVSFPAEEENPVNEIEGIGLTGEKKNLSFDSTYDIQWLLLILLLIISLIEWEVYLYEQRRIR